MLKFVKRVFFHIIHYVVRYWFFVENLIYCCVNMFKERLRVPPVKDRLLTMSAVKVAQAIKDGEVG